MTSAITLGGGAIDASKMPEERSEYLPSRSREGCSRELEKSSAVSLGREIIE